jgi:hypothetical protein
MRETTNCDSFRPLWAATTVALRAPFVAAQRESFLDSFYDVAALLGVYDVVTFDT